MQICMLSELFYPYLLGGAERRYYEIAVRLAERHDVTVISLRFDGHESAEEHRGVMIERIGSSHPPDKRSVPALVTYFPALLKAAAKRCDLIDANQGIASFSGLFRPLIRKPVVGTFHDVYWKQWNEYFPFPLSSLGRSMEFAWVKMPFSALIANSPVTAKKLRYLGAKNISTIPSGVDFSFIQNMRAKKKKGSIIYVGRLVKYKNVETLIKAVSQLKNKSGTELKIIGSGPEETNLRNLARQLGVNAQFLGFVSEEEKFRHIKSSEILVNPSSVEGLGLVLIEAMAAGTPVVAKNLDAYFFCNGKNAALYNSDNELAGTISGILGSTKRKNSLIKHGYATAKKYSWDSVAKSVEKLYEGLI